MNWQRVLLIALFDLRCSILKAKGLLFIVPFAFLWYLILGTVDQNVATWLHSREGLLVAATLYNADTARLLFVEHPPVLSIYLLVALGTAPFFVILGTHDQFSSDLGTGYFRFLSSRCGRSEIFLGRWLGALILLAGAYAVAAIIAGLLSLRYDDYATTDIGLYLVQVYITVFLYAAALLSWVSVASSLARSAVGALFIGMIGYTTMLLGVWIVDRLLDTGGVLRYLLPSAVKIDLLGLNPATASLAAASLPVYTLVYGALAWRIFKAADL